MTIQIDYHSLENLPESKEFFIIQNTFKNLISEIAEYLEIEPLFQDVKIDLIEEDDLFEEASVLDFGVQRFIEDGLLIININEKHKKFLSFILLREAYYCFVPTDISELIKVCINQIVENDLNKLSLFKEWRSYIRDSLVNRDFIHKQFDKLEKFFKIEAKEPLESSVKFFFKEIRENNSLINSNDINYFYDLIFESYSYKTSRSLFDKDIIETLRIIIRLFYEIKSYLNLSDYQNHFRKFLENKKIKTDLSYRKFIENFQWMNKCSAVAPSYDIYYNIIDLCSIICFIKFNPLLEKNKIKKVIEEWPFFHSLKFSNNSFSIDISLSFILPNNYVNDLLYYFNKLELYGYIIEKKIYLISKSTNFLNLNYFTEMSNAKIVINPNGIDYNDKYEIEHELEYTSISHPKPLSFFEFTILDRIKYVSVTGLTFDKRSETLNNIKEDLQNELRKYINFDRDFKNRLKTILNDQNLKDNFLQFLKKNHSLGFFYLYNQLKNILSHLKLIEHVLANNPEITNIFKLQKFLNYKYISPIIEENILIKDESIRKIVINEFLPLIFQSEKLYKTEFNKFQLFYDFLKSCNNIKILNISDIEKICEKKDSKSPDLAEKIYNIKEEKLQMLLNSINLYQITNQKIESTIEKSLNQNPPLIKPYLINTIFTSTFAKYYPILIIKDTSKNLKSLKILKSYFPRLYLFKVADIEKKLNLICVSIFSVNIKEKEMFISIIFNLFKDSILLAKRFFWRGIQRLSKYRLKDFFDFNSKKFLYKEDLFNQLFIFSEKILGNRLKCPSYQSNEINEVFWSTDQNINNLVNSVKKRISNQNINFDLTELKNLYLFVKNIETFLLNHSKFMSAKSEKFFKRYIDSINFIPAFQRFGFSQYYLYFRPFNYYNIDFRLLFLNSLQKVKFPACIEPINPLFCKFIFPYRNANKSFLNWLIKSKKEVYEYCLFYKKKFYEIFHFNRNLGREGWNYSSIRFKSFIQDVLFNPLYDLKVSGIREFDLSEKNDSHNYGPNTQEFESITGIYNLHSIDIKSYLATKKSITIKNIRFLLKNKIIFPYLSLKNLGFQEKISIILPDIEKKFNEKLIKIFSFFNYCHIFEIEGEFFIYGFEDIKLFENGLLIEIWVPKCELDEFFEVFDLIFEYFKIKHYLILTDLSDGKNLLKSVYGDLKFLDDYNPLKNLIWNDKDKIWMNHKLFNEKFEPIYPDLLYGKKRENS